MSGPLTVTVTTGIIACLVGDPYKPSFATVAGRRPHPKDMTVHGSGIHEKTCNILCSHHFGFWSCKGNEWENQKYGRCLSLVASSSSWKWQYNSQQNITLRKHSRLISDTFIEGAAAVLPNWHTFRIQASILLIWHGFIMLWNVASLLICSLK